MRSRRRKQPETENQRAQYMLLDIRNVQMTSFQFEADDEETLVLLAASIARHGLLEPILVRKSLQAGQYLLVSGARRLAACRIAGVTQVHAMVIEGDEREAAACWLEGHMTRRQPSFLSEAAVICRAGVEQVKQRFALPKAYLESRFQMLALPLNVREVVKKQGLLLEQAKPLLEIRHEQKQLEAAELIAQRGLSAKQARRLVCGPEAGKNRSSDKRNMSAAIADVEAAIRSLQARGFQVQAGMHSQDEGVCIQIYLRDLRVCRRSAGNRSENAN